MRMMLKVNIPTEEANAAMKAGTFVKTLQGILSELKPEAAYFAEDDGMRTAYLFFDMSDSSELPRVSEPWFHAFNADLTVRPAMSQEDLAKAGPHIERAVKAYG